MVYKKINSLCRTCAVNAFTVHVGGTEFNFGSGMFARELPDVVEEIIEHREKHTRISAYLEFESYDGLYLPFRLFFPVIMDDHFRQNTQSTLPPLSLAFVNQPFQQGVNKLRHPPARRNHPVKVVPAGLIESRSAILDVAFVKHSALRRVAERFQLDIAGLELEERVLQVFIESQNSASFSSESPTSTSR